MACMPPMLVNVVMVVKCNVGRSISISETGWTTGMLGGRL